MSTAAERFTRRWVALYTRRLPYDLRDERRAEIDSDLWEHHAELEERREQTWLASLEIVARTVTGMPADLAWRNQQLSMTRGASGVTPIGGTTMQTTETATKQGYPAWLVVIASAMAVIAFGAGIAAVLGSGSDDEATTRWGLFLIVDAAGIGAGLALARRAPVVSVALLALGALGWGILTFWMVVTLAAGVVVAIATLLCAPRLVRTRAAI